MARYGQTFKDRAVARLLPPESAAIDLVAREIGIGTGKVYDKAAPSQRPVVVPNPEVQRNRERAAPVR